MEVWSAVCHGSLCFENVGRYMEVARLSKNIALERCFCMERVRGIEPLSPTWKAGVIATIRYPRIDLWAYIRRFYGGGQV